MKNPIKILKEEHNLLLHAIETGKHIQDLKDNEYYYELMHDLIIFFRNFTEIYHYPKEENILYPILRSRSEKMSPEFIHEICDNHDDFKAMVAEIENHYLLHNYLSLRITMKKYLEELADHIRTENHVIFSVAGQLLSEKECEEIYDEFMDVDKKYGEKQELRKSYFKMLNQLA